MMKGKKTGPNISVSHVIKSFIIPFLPVFDMLVFFFILLFSTSTTTGALQEKCSPTPYMADGKLISKHSNKSQHESWSFEALGCFSPAALLCT